MTSKPHRHLSACHRHPSAPVTGFCALCLRERLSGIPSHASSSPPHRPRSTLSDLFTRDGHSNTTPVPNEEQTKTVKEFIDLELNRPKRRTFWNLATHNFKNWTFKHGSNIIVYGQYNNDGTERQRARPLGHTQLDVGDYNLGRKSCHTDPRFSIDVPRISFDCPRASWDGCLIGKSCSRLSPLTSLDEDFNSNASNNDVVGFGLECSGDGRRSFGFDTSNSRRRQSIAGLDELNLMSNANANAKMSPAAFYGAKLLITEKELMDSYVRSSSDVVSSDCVMESDSKDVSDLSSRQKGSKKLQKWRGIWNKLGVIPRTERREERMVEEEFDSGVVADKPPAECLQRLRRVVNVQANEPFDPKLMRSYSVSCTSPCTTDGFVEDSESKGNALNGRHEFMFQRNRSVRYSPNNPDTGLLRFYLTPTKSHRRSKTTTGSIKDLHSAATSGL